MRKTRSDAILLNLPEDQQAKLAGWLLNGVPYHEARVLVEKEFGLSLKSLDPFKNFWREVCQPALLARRARAHSTAEQRAEEAKRNPGQFDLATLDAIKQKAYEISEQPDASPKDVKAILMLVLKARDQDLEERRIAVLEKKALQAEQAKGVLEDKELNEAQRAARMREIFGIS
jgi:hypothetical protein